MAVEAYINFRGNCREAVEFYAEVFDTEEPNFLLFGDMPTDGGYSGNDEVKNLVMHTELKINGSTVMFSDVPPGMPFTLGNNISLIVRCKDMDQVNNIFDMLREGGQVIMELQETFWSKCYGFVTDRFGIGWQVSFDNEQNLSVS
jgi:Uncharacterized protein conserved in bacteria